MEFISFKCYDLLAATYQEKLCLSATERISEEPEYLMSSDFFDNNMIKFLKNSYHFKHLKEKM